jgi:MoxR-like ATPase
MAHLIFTKGDREWQAVALEGKPLLVGRKDGCDLIIHDVLVSSQHARLDMRNGRWFLTDLDSSNGTYVNGVLIRSVPLKEGDLVGLGNEELVFGEGPAPDSAVRAALAPVAAEPEASPAAAKSAPPPAIMLTPTRPPDPVAARPPRPVGPPSPMGADLDLVQEMKARTDAIREEVGKVIVGQTEVLDQILMVLLAGGHGLLVGMPGMAKTLMVSTIARVLDMGFKRIQFTPDLMPTDITGTEVLETNRTTNEKEFRFMQGPLFTNLLLADEINRTPPKTQAALLEAMQEKRVTVGNKTYTLEAPFFVLATQNPIEQEGTYPLPEAQMDRFMFFIWVDYPGEQEEETIIATTTVKRLVQPERVLTREQVLQLQDVVSRIPVSEHVIKYATRLVRATRPADPKAPDFVKQYVSTGAGPRAGQFLIMSAKARAVLEGRIHVSCADVKRAALPVLRHRLYTNFAADSEGITSTTLIQKLLNAVPEPGPEDYKA